MYFMFFKNPSLYGNKILLMTQIHQFQPTEPATGKTELTTETDLLLNTDVSRNHESKPKRA